MNAQFGLVNVWSQGDLVTRGVLLLLLALSLASWIVILLKAMDLRRYLAQASGTRMARHPGIRARSSGRTRYRPLGACMRACVMRSQRLP